jgi:hypothetical protein
MKYSNSDCTPPLHLQQPVGKLLILAWDSDLQHLFMYVYEFSGYSILISWIFIAK